MFLDKTFGQEFVIALKWYIANDDTHEGGSWDDKNSYYLAGKARAQKLVDAYESIHGKVNMDGHL